MKVKLKFKAMKKIEIIKSRRVVNIIIGEKRYMMGRHHNIRDTWNIVKTVLKHYLG